MRNILLLIFGFGLFFVPSALATNDIAILSFTADKAIVQAGGEITLTIRVKNLGPDAAPNVNFNFGNSYDTPMYPLSPVTVSGWNCSAAFVTCFTAESMPANAEVTLSYRIVIPATYRENPLVLSMFGGALQDSNRENNRAELTIATQPADRSADLSLTIGAPPNPVAPGTPVTLAYDIRNNGPNDLSDVRVAIHLPLLGATPTFEGAGWTCTSGDSFNETCQRASLAANANAPLSARFTAPSASLPVSSQVSVFSAQAHLDTNPSNDRAYHTLSVGNASDWHRVLVPFTSAETPGAHGSLWKSEITGIIEGIALPQTAPSGCGPIEDPCAPPPLNRSFDAFDEGLVVGEGRPQFIYFKSTSDAKLSLSTRVYDASKSETTAGAFVPTAGDEDFSPTGFTLLGIPNAPEFRSALRIYDANGTGGDVEVALYRMNENTPFAAEVVTLAPVESQFLVTNALLPLFPAITQLDLGALLPQGEMRVRVSVRPLPAELPAPAMRLWGFASITNNATSHVTVVTP